ncbi:hypothetical protein G6045_08890 [Streptomyces sp. YC504]|uniref:DUF11 domain-containing protein n=1 Tax=Streptomyces mesophilus TaxID=1775132 RepID=A0A6G4XEG7_9ACTN|nr:hypothetical protein [Streptomyces mesophilus]NGO75788.1 hypothetical protein [Streptomyces mesophilus]
MPFPSLVSMARTKGMRLAVTATAVLAVTAPTAQAGPAPAGDGKVDLVITSTPPTIAPGKTGVQKLVVANNGTTTKGQTLVTFATPSYVNIDRKAKLPKGCTIRYANPDPTVNEVLVCRLPEGLAKGKPVTVPVPLVVTERARLTGIVLGRAAAVPVPGSKDTEANLSDNWAITQLMLTRPTPPTPGGNKVGLYLTRDTPATDVDGRAEATFTYGNVGPNESGTIQITVVTPFLTQIDKGRELPEGCEIKLNEPTPGVPEIVVCRVDGLDVEEQDTLTLPLRVRDTAPAGVLYGLALIAPADKADVDTDQQDNLSASGVHVPSRQDSSCGTRRCAR